jgi:glycerol kinase
MVSRAMQRQVAIGSRPTSEQSIKAPPARGSSYSTAPERIVASAQKEHQQIYPQPGWVEHDPDEIWRRTEEVVAAAMEQRGLGPRDLAAIGITNQRETTVLWNRTTGRPLYNALVWQDTRVADYIPELARAGGPDRFRAKTGLPLATYFSALKIRWMLDHVPGARQQAEAGDVLFGNIDTFWSGISPAAGSTSPIAPTPAARS